MLLKYASEPRFIEKAMRQYKDFAFQKLTEKSISSFRTESTAAYLSALTIDAASIEADDLSQLLSVITKAVTFFGALEQEKFSRRRVKALVGMIGATTGIIAQLAVFLAGAYLALSGKGLTAGAVILFVNLMNFMIEPVAELPALLAARKAARGLIDKLADALEQDETQPDGMQIAPLPLRGCGKFALRSKFAGLCGFACVRFLILYTYPYMPRTETSPEAMVDFVPSGSVTRRAASESMASAWA